MLKLLILRTLLTNGAILALGLVTSIVLSRWLGATGRGELAAAMLWPLILGYLGTTGLIPAVMYFTALSESRTDVIFFNAMVAAAIQSLLLVPLGFLLLPWLLRSQSATVVAASRIYLLFIPIFLVTQYSASILQGRLQMFLYNCSRLLIPLGHLIGVLALMTAGVLTVRNLVILHLAINAAGMMVMLWGLICSGTRLGLRPDVALAREMLSYGIRAQVGDLSQTANLRLDQTMMAAFLQPAQLGLYTVAVSCAGLAQVLSSAVRTVLTPCIARTSASERATMLKILFRRYWTVSIVVTGAIAMVLPATIPLVYGSEFQKSVLPAQVLVLGTLFLGGKEVLAGAVQALGDPWLGSRAEIASAVATLVLLLILLPTLGIIGAATASLVAYAIQFGLLVLGLKQAYGIAPGELLELRVHELSKVLLIIVRLVAGSKPPARWLR
jgi:O-antigen/teichoic acid export membrane protein